MTLARINERSTDLAALLLRPPLLIAGIVVAILATRLARSAAHRAIQESDRSPITIDRVRRSFVGCPPSFVRRVLGNPRAVSADTWYFPLDSGDRSVIVVEFSGSRVRDLQLLRSPTPVDLT